MLSLSINQYIARVLWGQAGSKVTKGTKGSLDWVVPWLATITSWPQITQNNYPSTNHGREIMDDETRQSVRIWQMYNSIYCERWSDKHVPISFPIHYLKCWEPRQNGSFSRGEHVQRELSMIKLSECLRFLKLMFQRKICRRRYSSPNVYIN